MTSEPVRARTETAHQFQEILFGQARIVDTAGLAA